MKRLRQSGFTMIELVVVVAVIAILAVITATMYQNAQVQARDTQIRDAADKFADALKLWSINHSGAKPNGGWATAGTNSLSGDNCVGGANGWQNYSMGGTFNTYLCTVGDVLVASGYLPAKMFQTLPVNTTYGDNLRVFMTYPCSGYPNQWVLFYPLEDPTASDDSEFDAVTTKCANNTATMRSYGMRGVIEVKFA